MPNADETDQLLGFVSGYTNAPSVTEHDRLAMLGNTMHVQAASRCLQDLPLPDAQPSSSDDEENW